MGTPINVVLDSFHMKIEKDFDFFEYQNVSDDDAAKIIEERSLRYLNEAISKMYLYGSPDISLEYKTNENCFDEMLTRIEIELISSLMAESHFHRDYASLKANQIQFSPKELNHFSPANERKTFVEMYKGIVEENRISLSQYFSRDRLTNKLKGIDYASHQSE